MTFLLTAAAWISGFLIGGWTAYRIQKGDADHWMNEAITARGALQTAKREPPRHPVFGEPCPPPKPKEPKTIGELMEWYRTGTGWISDQVRHDIAHHVTWGTVDELMPRVEDEPT